MNTVAQCINIAAGKTLINKLQIPISKIIIPTTYPKHTPAGLNRILRSNQNQLAHH